MHAAAYKITSHSNSHVVVGLPRESPFRDVLQLILLMTMSEPRWRLLFAARVAGLRGNL